MAKRRSTTVNTVTIPGYIRNYDKSFLMCRDIGHNWSYTVVQIIRNRSRHLRGYRQEMQCSTCSTIKYRWINPDGTVGSASYRYPDLYLIPSEIGRLSEDRAALRLAAIHESNLPTVEWVEEEPLVVEA